MLSRANGSKSRGPKFSEGKRISSRNAMTHALLSGTIVLERESPDRFLNLHNELLDEFQPQTPFEKALIDTMAVARWRQMAHLESLERATMEREMRLQDEFSGSAEDSSVLAAMAFRAIGDGSCAPTSSTDMILVWIANTSALTVASSKCVIAAFPLPLRKLEMAEAAPIIPPAPSRTPQPSLKPCPPGFRPRPTPPKKQILPNEPSKSLQTKQRRGGIVFIALRK